MHPKEKMHEVRFPNIFILSNVYYIVPLTIIIVSLIKGVGFSNVRQTLINKHYIAMHYGDIED